MRDQNSGDRQRALVMGASGNIGACVVRHLVERGDDVRVLLRKSSSTKGIDGLDVQRCYGDIFDVDAVTAAMADRDVVYYCVVDTRAELRDPSRCSPRTSRGCGVCWTSRWAPACTGSSSSARSAPSPSAGTGRQHELVTLAADAVGVRPPRFGIPVAAVHALAHVLEAASAVFKRDLPMGRASARLLALTSPADHSKATRELGWHPAPTEDAIARAAHFYVERSRRG